MEYLLGPLAQYGPIGSQKSCVNSITEFSIFFLFFSLRLQNFSLFLVCRTSYYFVSQSQRVCFFVFAIIVIKLGSAFKGNIYTTCEWHTNFTNFEYFHFVATTLTILHKCISLNLLSVLINARSMNLQNMNLV